MNMEATLKLLEKALLAIKSFVVEHFAYQDEVKTPLIPSDLPITRTETPKVVLPPTQKPIIHSTAWRGGALAERMEMYDLAHSVCREQALTLAMERDLQATIAGESGWNQWTINANNKNGTTDWGICQFNDGKNKQGVPFWIGKGAAFKDKDECLNDPAKCIRVMAREFKRGNAKWWVAYSSGGYKQYLDTKPI